MGLMGLMGFDWIRLDWMNWMGLDEMGLDWMDWIGLIHLDLFRSGLD